MTGEFKGSIVPSEARLVAQRIVFEEGKFVKSSHLLGRVTAALLTTLLASFATASQIMAATPPCGRPPRIKGCAIFPGNNIWNIPIDELPVSSHSGAYIASIGPATGLHADFGSGTWAGGPIGIPFCSVSGDQPAVEISFTYAEESDPGPWPIPTDAPIEGGSHSDGDRHVLVLDRDNCMLYELYDAHPLGDGSWRAGSGAIFDLGSNELRPQEWTSADAAGLPILPGLVRYEEVRSGEIRHAIRFTASRTQKAYVWPARHQASYHTDPNLPPMGQRFRLRADFDVQGYSFEVRVILAAMKKYGLILADNGSSWFISGVPDERWDNDMLRELRTVHGSDFEALDCSSYMVEPNSARVICGSAMPHRLLLPLLMKR